MIHACCKHCAEQLLELEARLREAESALMVYQQNNGVIANAYFHKYGRKDPK